MLVAQHIARDITVEIEGSSLLRDVEVEPTPAALVVSGRAPSARQRTECAWRATVAVSSLWAAELVPLAVSLRVHLDPVTYEAPGSVVEAVGRGAERSWWRGRVTLAIRRTSTG